MSLFLQENATKEKAKLIIKIIDFYFEKKFTSDEIHYILDIVILSEISKDDLISSDLRDKLSEFANLELSNYSSVINDIEQCDLLFGEKELKTKLIELNVFLKKFV